MLRQGGGDIGGQGGGGAGQHSLDEVGEPDQHIGEDKGGRRPCHGHGLDVLDSGLGMDIYGGLVVMFVRVGAEVHGLVHVVDGAGLFLGTSVGLRRHGLLGWRGARRAAGEGQGEGWGEEQ